LVRELSEMDLYRERVEILKSVPGIGTLAAMELLLELQDVVRFRHADQLAAYVGLPPLSTRVPIKSEWDASPRWEKHSLRALLVQAAWQLIRKDLAMKEKYERIKIRAGGKAGDCGNRSDASFASKTDLVGCHSVSISFECLESNLRLVGDGVVYSCVHQMDDTLASLAHPHTKDLGWITCGSRKKETTK